MNIHQYYAVDVMNGPGTRTLFVAGCAHRCRGCYNQSTWRVDSGTPFSLQMEERLIADLNDTRIIRQGLSLSGGDPLHPANLADVRRLLSRVRRECQNKDIWMWTGYRLQELSVSQLRVIDLVNVLIDGEFIQALKDPSLLWRGSSNQVIHQLR
ncbi:anaerobic ribonucleoside-triphosphate reductase-activating protein [Erwinia amylovora]|uniref:anaerobic ribonucleoside-triphosphate reductase-activating protein n=1 Tax=Erwinia amylovora TaxID=552 RepID=UPI0014444A62|nr:anaerobic ribonucleoside-triphosphate reductase-activating protein [Erwinia amylovora]